jgi:4-amino-4-deoxy-L-arabinose transferase-like glycosyltransferase
MTRYILWAIIVLALLVRIAPLRTPPAVEYADGAAYAIVGKNIISGNGIRDWYGPHTLWPPFYPALLGVFSLAVPDPEMAGRLVSFLTAMLALLFLYLIARELFSPETALYTVLFTSLHPDLSRTSLAVLTESAYLCLLLSGIWLTLLTLKRRRIGFLFLTGLIIGCAYLTRPEAIGFVLLIPASVGCAHFLSAGERKGAAGGIVVFLVGFLLIATPYVFFLKAHTGQWGISGKARHNLAITDPRLGDTLKEKYYGLGSDGRTVGLERVSIPEVMDYWKKHPTALAKRYVRLFVKQYDGTLPQVFHPLLIALLGIGLYHGRWRNQTWGKLLVLGALFPLLVYPLSHLEYRYLVPLVPFMLIWTGHGAAVVMEGLRSTEPGTVLFGRRIPFRGFALVVMLTLLLFYYRDFVAQPFAMGREEKVLGHWIKDHVGVGARIMDRSHVVAFHAEGVPLELPFAPLDEMLEYGARHDADYLVVCDDRRHKPELRMLIEQTSVPPELRVVHVLERSEAAKIGKKMVLYQLR